MRRSGKEMRKRKHLPPITALVLALVVLAGAFTGCSVKEQAPDDGRMKVVTTIFPPYDFARAISGNGELAHVRMLLKPGEEIHSYEPTPLDIKEIQNCDLFIYVGAENDFWVDRILENMGDHKPQALKLVEITDTVAEEIVEGMMEEREHEHESEESEHINGGDSSHEEHEEADEHVWTSPVKAAEITEAIAQKMAEIDPENAKAYLANAKAYEEQILGSRAALRNRSPARRRWPF